MKHILGTGFLHKGDDGDVIFDPDYIGFKYRGRCREMSLCRVPVYTLHPRKPGKREL